MPISPEMNVLGETVDRHYPVGTGVLTNYHSVVADPQKHSFGAPLSAYK